jgi:hypothetical protein
MRAFMKRYQLPCNILCYYAVWFSCVLSAAQHMDWLGVTIALVITLVQCPCFYSQPYYKGLACFMLLLTTLGFIIDSGLSLFGCIQFHANPWPVALAPPWIIGLWLNFSFILYVHLKAYFHYFLPLFFLSLVGFPLAYCAGVKLSAASLPLGYVGLAILGCTWAVCFPSVLYFASKWQGGEIHG